MSLSFMLCSFSKETKDQSLGLFLWPSLSLAWRCMNAVPGRCSLQLSLTCLVPAAAVSSSNSIPGQPQESHSSPGMKSSHQLHTSAAFRAVVAQGDGLKGSSRVTIKTASGPLKTAAGKTDRAQTTSLWTLPRSDRGPTPQC